MENILNHIDILDKKIFEILIVFFNYEFIVNTAEFIVHEKNFFPYLAVIMVLYLTAKPRKALLFLLLFIILLSFSELITTFLKSYFGRNRPSVQTGIFIKSANHSFPSAHAFNSMAMAYFLGYWFSSKKNLFFSLSILIGVSRLLADYHFPFDIAAGWIGGFVIAFIYVKIIKQISLFYARKKYRFT